MNSIQEHDIKVVNNFLTRGECEFYIDYINSNLDKFIKFERTMRYTLLFGRDLAHKEQSHLDLSLISDIDEKIRKLFERVEGAVGASFQSKKNLYTCSFFMAKQVSGSVVPEHYDSDNGLNTHFKYGGVIYLNTMSNDGNLEFPYIPYSYSPKAGDFVFFPSDSIGYSHYVSKISEDRYSLPIWVTEQEDWKIV